WRIGRAAGNTRSIHREPSRGPAPPAAGALCQAHAACRGHTRRLHPPNPAHVAKEAFVAILIVVNDPRKWPFNIPGVEVVDARSYLTKPQYSDMRSVKVFNL